MRNKEFFLFLLQSDTDNMNPFVLNNYLSPEFFCDREHEMELLLKNIESRSNTAIFSQRRMGKTALVKHVFHFLGKKKGIIPIYLDIYPTSSLKEFSDALSTAIYNVFPLQASVGRKFWEHIKLLRPVVRVNTLSGAPELSLDISNPEQIDRTVPQLFSFLAKQNNQVVIAIDEFQQILSYPEKRVEALLRTTIQGLNNVSFLFLGSDRELMSEMFNSAKRPFYASAKYLILDKISAESYQIFIKDVFAKYGISVKDDALKMILESTQRHTFYTQLLCHEIFSTNNTHIEEQTVLETLYKILKQYEPIFFQYRSLLTKSQWNVLKAVGAEEKVVKPYAQDFIRKYNLNSSSNVKRSLDALTEKSIVYHNRSVEDPFYEVEDKFLMRWLQNN